MSLRPIFHYRCMTSYPSMASFNLLMSNHISTLLYLVPYCYSMDITIYCITFPDGYYVGSTNNFDRRKKQRLYNYNRWKRGLYQKSSKLFQAIDKTDTLHYQVLETLSANDYPSADKLQQARRTREQYWIDKKDSVKNGYNSRNEIKPKQIKSEQLYKCACCQYSTKHSGHYQRHMRSKKHARAAHSQPGVRKPSVLSMSISLVFSRFGNDVILSNSP